AKDAALLKIHEGAPVLNLVRSTFNIENEVIEYTLSVARADQFRYKVRHLRNDE
ncbi:UTRA domain-containing protein, partial [Enterobacter roggenkampii]|nr:UTRA domain-containing protein [Enterobacter roggenkampii]